MIIAALRDSEIDCTSFVMKPVVGAHGSILEYRMRATITCFDLRPLLNTNHTQGQYFTKKLLKTQFWLSKMG